MSPEDGPERGGLKAAWMTLGPLTRALIVVAIILPCWYFTLHGLENYGRPNRKAGLSQFCEATSAPICASMAKFDAEEERCFQLAKNDSTYGPGTYTPCMEKVAPGWRRYWKVQDEKRLAKHRHNTRLF